MLKGLFHVAVEACHLGAIGSNELKQLTFFHLRFEDLLNLQLKTDRKVCFKPYFPRSFLELSCLLRPKRRKSTILQSSMQSLSVDGQHGLWSEGKTFDYANFSDSYGFFTSFDFWNTPSSTKTSFQIDVALTLYVAECRWHPWDTGDKQLSFWILQWYTDSFPASKAWTAMFWSTCPGKDRWHRQICSVSSFPKFDYFVAALKKTHRQTFASNLRKHTWSRHIQKLKPPGAKREKWGRFRRWECGICGM